MEARGMGTKARGMGIAANRQKVIGPIFEIGWQEEFLYKTLR